MSTTGTGVTESRTRRAEEIKPAEVADALDRLGELVDARLPERFYAGEAEWRSASTALVARIAQVARSISCLIRAEHHTEALVLLRVLYEHVVVTAWVLAAPETRLEAWRESASARLRAIHHDGKRYGLNVLTSEQLAAAQGATTLPSVLDLAAEVDAFWPARVDAFRTFTGERVFADIYTLRGLYTALYRMASPRLHGEATSLTAVINTDPRGRIVVDPGDDRTSAYLMPVAAPLMALALAATHYRLGWPDQGAVREINNALFLRPAGGT